MVGQSKGPEVRVSHALIGGSPDIPDVMPEFPQQLHGHSRDILVNEDAHASVAGYLYGRDLFFTESCHFNGVVMRFIKLGFLALLLALIASVATAQADEEENRAGSGA